MTTQSRGDALAAAVENIAAAAIRTPTDRTRDNLREALAAYRATAPTGESVRAAWAIAPDGKWCVTGYSNEDDEGNRENAIEFCPGDGDVADLHTGFVTFTLPPRPNPPEIEGVVDAKETE